ncbi:MAG: DUF1192 domain-containing protein [Pseudomonadota bacterium]
MDEGESVLSNTPRPLEDMSVEELKAKVLALGAEIEACEAEIARKLAHRSAADAMFGGSD